MPTLTQFDTPGRLTELDGQARAAWSDVVDRMIAVRAAEFAQFYNPRVDDTPAGLIPAEVAWPAFPAQVIREVGPGAARFDVADTSRDRQDEYCEWAVERRDDKIVRVTFTTEVPEYWEHIAVHDPDLLLELYRDLVDGRVQPADLFKDGKYDPTNTWNTQTQGRPAHLVQSTNNLDAAIQLVADATVLRRRADGTPVTDRQELVACGDLGEPFRNSDPQIAEIVNDAAALGTEITLLDPIGLYLDGLLTAGMQTPDGADAAEFWHRERGEPGHVVRAAFWVPDDRGYTVGDIKVNGRQINRGAQIADKVRVRTHAVVKPGGHQPIRQPCVA